MDDQAKIENNIVRVLEAFEPWLLQLLRYNPATHHMEEARKETANALAELAEEFERDR